VINNADLFEGVSQIPTFVEKIFEKISGRRNLQLLEPKYFLKECR
jgi:hypothetical protein